MIKVIVSMFKEKNIEIRQVHLMCIYVYCQYIIVRNKSFGSIDFQAGKMSGNGILIGLLEENDSLCILFVNRWLEFF